MDGKGYPRGLGAAALSVNARIIAIADIFEALTAQDRPYKTAHSASEAIAIMRTLSARQVIDADLFDLFVACGAWRDDGTLGGEAAIEAWAMPQPKPHQSPGEAPARNASEGWQPGRLTSSVARS
jgi:hypothetical protein